MDLQVDCRASHVGDPEPFAFRIGKRPIGVSQVQDRWLAKHYCYFKLETDDDATYILRHDDRSGIWEMVLFQAGAYR